MNLLTDQNNVIKVEDNLSFDHDFISTGYINYHNTLYHSPSPKHIDTDENKFEVEKDDLDHQDVNQEYTSSEHNIPNDLRYKPTTSEDYVMENIEAENDISMIQTKDTTDCKDSGLTIKKVGNHMSTVPSKKPCSCHKSNKPFNDKANGTEHLITHTATKSHSCGNVFRHNSNLTEKSVSVQPLPRDAAIDGIKLECDDSVKQGKTNQEHLTNNDMFGGSTTTEDFVIDDIKFENDDAVTLGRINTEDKIDYDSECKTITTQDFVTDNIKVKIKQEIITTEDCTNIDMILYRSSLPADVGFNSVKVETCAGMKKDGVNESATNADVKHEDIFMGEDYSSDDNIPRAEEKAKLSATAVQHVTKIPNDSSQVRVDTRRGPAADGGLTVDKLSCDICPYQTNSESQLFSHLKAQDAVHKNRLQGQIKLHSSKKTYSCDICSKNFCYKSKLTVHLREKPFSCKVCHKTFSKRPYLSRHMRTHSGEKPFSCDVCHKAFSEKKNLIVHLRLHSGEKPFSCEVCHKAFSKKNNLKVHLRIHSGEKPFSCDVCHKAFNEKNNLKVHLRIHSGEKPFSCEVCHKAFSIRSYLTRHMSTHSGKKLFSC